MEKDPFNFHDLSTSINETEVRSCTENDPTMENLVSQSEGSETGEASLEGRSPMSLARKLWYTARSLSWWKAKAQVKQEKNRSMEKKIQDLTKSRDKWRQRAVDAEKQVKAHAEPANQVQTEASLKQNRFSRHD